MMHGQPHVRFRTIVYFAHAVNIFLSYVVHSAVTACATDIDWSTAYRHVARMLTALFYGSALSSEFDKHELFLPACFVLQIALICTVSI